MAHTVGIGLAQVPERERIDAPDIRLSRVPMERACKEGFRE